MRPRPSSPSGSSQPNHLALQAFRGDVRVAPGLHPLETALVVIVSTLLCFMPWALGTMQIWSQSVTLGLAAVALGLSLVKRHYTGSLAPQGDFTLVMWPKLLRFPLFWLGLVFLGYILVQALNPAWLYVSQGRMWWLQRVDHIEWLPAGIDAPLKDMNAWRVLMIYASVWLLGCSIWVGITRRSAIQTILTVVVANGTLLALAGILARVTNAKHVLWIIESANTSGAFFATIIYKNHAGAYLNLVLMLCTGLLYWHFSRAERRMERSSPAAVFAFCLVLLGLSVMLTNSRASTILLMVFTLAAFIGFIVRCTVNKHEGRNPWTIVLLCTIFALFIGVGSLFLNTGNMMKRLGRLMEEGKTDSSVYTRTLARSATLDMAKDNLVTGWGAGSFRHYFPVHQRNYPDIYVTNGGRTYMRWEYAHNDYVQLIAELGLVGASFIAAMLACCLRHAVRTKIWLRPHLMFLASAPLVTAAHAWVDFQFHNPAILTLWGAALVLVGRWAELENRRATSA